MGGAEWPADEACLQWVLPNDRCEMSKLLRGIAAGWGAKKLGGGCLTTILVFALLWWALGHFHIFQ
jgi:hypothetical protein